MNKMESRKATATAPIDIPSNSRKTGPELKSGSNASETSHPSSNLANSVESRMSPLIAARRLLKSVSSNSTKPYMAQSRVNIVADSCTVLPSLASSFSLEVQPLSPKIGKKLSDIKNIGDINQVRDPRPNFVLFVTFLFDFTLSMKLVKVGKCVYFLFLFSIKSCISN